MRTHITKPPIKSHGERQDAVKTCASYTLLCMVNSRSTEGPVSLLAPQCVARFGYSRAYLGCPVCSLGATLCVALLSRKKAVSTGVQHLLFAVANSVSCQARSYKKNLRLHHSGQRRHLHGKCLLLDGATQNWRETRVASEGQHRP